VVKFMITKMQLTLALATKTILKRNIQISYSSSKLSVCIQNLSVTFAHINRMTPFIKMALVIPRLLAICLSSMVLILMMQPAVASGTASGTLISNLATITYRIDDVAQGPVTSSPATFLVDNMVNLTVAETSGTFTTAGVLSGAVDVITTFTVTNNGNTLQDYVLTVGQGDNGDTLFSKTDNVDVLSCSSVIESGANPGYQTEQDTATFIDELPPDMTKTVYVLCSIPLQQVSDDVSIISLLATTHAGSAPGMGQLTVADNGTDASDAVQVVFVDTSAGDPQGDNTAKNGQHSSRDGYWFDSQAVCSNPNAAAIVLDLTPVVAIDSGRQNNTPAILIAIAQWLGTDIEAYKDDQGEGESGPAKGWYSTTYNQDLSAAEIVWDGAPNTYITGPSYLLVKGGRQQPAWYLFDISSWDGMATISLSGFWPGRGSISHVSIFNAQACDGFLPRSITFDWADPDNNPSTFFEADANDGSIPFASTLKITNDTYTGTDGETLPGASVSNVPDGFTAVLTKTGSTTATLRLTGNATAHANANDIANLTVSLSDASFTLGNAAIVKGAFKNDILVDFIDWPVIDLTLAIIHIQHPSGCNEGRDHNRHRRYDDDGDNGDEDDSDDSDDDDDDDSDGCKLVPGSILTYQIEIPVTNSIDDLVITNPIATTMTYVSDSIFVNGVAKSDAIDSDNTQFNTNTNTIIVTAGIISTATTFSFTFRTTIN
jgi:hypothetical protein